MSRLNKLKGPAIYLSGVATGLVIATGAVIALAGGSGSDHEFRDQELGRRTRHQTDQ